MARFIALQDLGFWKKRLPLWKILLHEPLRHKSNLHRIRKHPWCLDEQGEHAYDQNKSYRYTWRNFSTQHALLENVEIDDRTIGGTSQATLIYDRQEQCLRLQGSIRTENRHKMIEHPFIALLWSFPHHLRIAPFNAISAQVCSDGHPIRIDVGIVSPLHGELMCYGTILAGPVGWHRYELLLVNMKLRGTENDRQSDTIINANPNSTLITESDLHDMQRLLYTELGDNQSPILTQINLRLISSRDCQRDVGIRNLSLVRRNGSASFEQEYRQPFFFIVPQELEQSHPALPVTVLQRGYKDFDLLDLGHKKLVRKTPEQQRENKSYFRQKFGRKI